MRFYKFEHSTDFKEIGVFDQIQSVLQPYDRWGSNSVSQIPLEGLIDFDLQIPKLQLASSALLTDFMHSVPTSRNLMLISPKFKKVLEGEKLDEHSFFETEVKANVDYKYYFLHFPYSKTEQFVNWEKSIFAHTTNLGKYFIKEIQFDDYFHFMDFKKSLFEKNEELKTRKLFLLDEFITVDMFRLLWTCTGTYISEKLKLKLETHSITGWTTTPVEELSEIILSEVYPDLYPQNNFN